MPPLPPDYVHAGPENARRAITALDKMVQGLKRNRKRCGDQIDEDNKTLEHLAHEKMKIREIYDPLCQTLEDRLALRAKLIHHITDATEKMQGFIDATKATARRGNTENRQHARKSATRALEASRGYTCRTGSTQMQFRRTSHGAGKPHGKIGRAASFLTKDGVIPGMVPSGDRPDSAEAQRARARSSQRPASSMN